MESYLFTIALQFNWTGRAVYVCICNRVTDQQLVEAAVESASGRSADCAASVAEQITDGLGAGLGCGSCREFALDLVKRAVMQQSSVVLPNLVSFSSCRDDSSEIGVNFNPGTLSSRTMTPLRPKQN